MDILIAFLVFICSVIFCLIVNLPLYFALAVGLICFYITGLHRGYGAKDLLKMIYKGGKTSFIVIKVLLLIGCLAALWRASGTIEFFVYYGIKFITPYLFIVIAFALPLVLSYLLGTSFGVVGTAGVMLMILARGGGVSPVIAAGAVMSGAFFGERCSPASSSAFLAASVSEVEIKDYLIMMFKTSVIPVIISLLFYIFLSIHNPINNAGAEITDALASGYNLSWYIALPAIILVVLPWFKIKVYYAIAASAVTAFILSMMFQEQSLIMMIKTCIFGYLPPSTVLSGILSGGGVVSMIAVILIVFLSSTYSGIFEGTGMIEPLQKKLSATSDKIGLFPTQIICALFSSSVFCNQTLGTILAAQMLGKAYREKDEPKIELASDIGCSIIVIAGLIPWSIAAAVPLAMMGVGRSALLLSVFLYAVPISYLFTKKIWFKRL
jgi:NhaC family Na+:H+ antiporter